MSGTMLGVIALGLVVVSLLVWMNVAMFKGRSKGQKAAVAAEEPLKHSRASSESAATLQPVAKASTPSPASEEVAISSPVKPIPIASRIEQPVEVMTEGGRESARKVFDRPAFPFVVKSTMVPMFRDDDWLQGFQRLTDDRRVLGWIAFSGETLGAADREYESGFVDVVRTYLTTLEKLRREVGLTNIRETSIMADEGHVWFLPAKDDTWFALFVEGNTDVHELSAHLLGAVMDSDA